MHRYVNADGDSIFYADWELDMPDGADGVHVYAGRFVRQWSGGAEFTVTADVARDIVRDQAGYDDDLCLTWEGDVLVFTPRDGAEVERISPDADGRYYIGFGWTWQYADACYACSGAVECDTCESKGWFVG
jgi:hypothetical protein